MQSDQVIADYAYRRGKALVVANWDYLSGELGGVKADVDGLRAGLPSLGVPVALRPNPDRTRGGAGPAAEVRGARSCPGTARGVC